MIRKCSLEEISDGRLYDTNDMVKAYCNECKGCHACCEGMGNSIILDPLDIMRLTTALGKSFEELLASELELNVVDGLVLPNIKMKNNACPFLNSEGRCSIHEARPGFCRLFPLGRYYEDGSFKYFLQIHECERAGKTKVKVSKWIDTPDIPRYTKYINDWHDFQKEIQEIIKKKLECEKEEEAKKLTVLVLNVMFMALYNDNEDFYHQFDSRLAKLRELSAIVSE
ncbi:MAG: YkgJ family cysteine cluster protein [Coprococcus sp.]